MDVKVILGAGMETKDGWFTLDKYAACKPSIEHDLEKLPLPFKDNEISELMANQVLEHIDGDKFIPLMNDCYRILKPGGLFHIECPYGWTMARMCDPTHKSYVVFTEFLMRYFNNKKLVEIGLFVGYGGSTCNFKELVCERHGGDNQGIRYILEALK